MVYIFCLYTKNCKRNQRRTRLYGRLTCLRTRDIMDQMSVQIIHGEALAVLRGRTSDSVGACVTDPPAGIAFMGKSWDYNKGGRRQWVAWLAEIMTEALRVVNPGGHAFVWALPRTSHWTATALEDAGWDIRDIITHVQSQGFPKSRALLKPSAEHWILARRSGPLQKLRIDDCRVGVGGQGAWSKPRGGICLPDPTASAELLPSAHGRWPANFVLSHSPPILDETGNVLSEGCRRVGVKKVRNTAGNISDAGPRENAIYGTDDRPRGDWTAYGENGTEEVEAWECVTDGSCPVAMLDAQSGVSRSRASKADHSPTTSTSPTCFTNIKSGVHFADAGTASRFYHCFEPDPFVYMSKAPPKERTGIVGQDDKAVKHPTQKSVALMRHLIRLVCAPGDTVIDPFFGSGTTGVAAMAEGVNCVGIERETDYIAIARARCGLSGEGEAPEADPAAEEDDEICDTESDENDSPDEDDYEIMFSRPVTALR